MYLPACMAPAPSAQSPFMGVPARMLQLRGALMSSGFLAWSQGLRALPQLLPHRRTKTDHVPGCWQRSGRSLLRRCRGSGLRSVSTLSADLAEVASSDLHRRSRGRVLPTACQGPAAPALGCSGACRRPPVAGGPRRLQGEGSWAPPSRPTRILEGGAWELHL